MTSGMDDDLRRVAAPGTRWAYNNNAYYVLRLLLEQVTDTAIGPLCDEWLWRPIGATESSWYQRPGAPDALGRPIWGLTMTVRDMARLGLLVERGGIWDGTEIMESSYLDAALRPSQDLRSHYGYLWWLNQDGVIPEAPDDMVAALGRGDQKLYVTRRNGLVVTRLGDSAGPEGDSGSTAFNAELWTKLMAPAPAER